MEASAILLLHTSGQDLALPTAAVAEIVLVPRLLLPPAAPPILAGVMDLRGAPVPVVRLDRLLGLPEMQAGLFGVVIVLTRPLNAPWGLLAERATDVVPTGSVAPPPHDLSFNDCVAGLIHGGEAAEFGHGGKAAEFGHGGEAAEFGHGGEAAGGGALVPLLSPERLLLRSEAEALAAFRNFAAARAGQWGVEDLADGRH